MCVCVCLEEKGREGEKTECLDQSVVSVNGHKRGISSKTDIQKLRTILGYHRCRMLTLEKKSNQIMDNVLIHSLIVTSNMVGKSV